MDEQPTRISEIVDEKLDNLIKNQGVITKVATDESDEKKPQHGGYREGSGRPKGALSPKKRSALEAKNRFIERVHKHVDELFDAQLQLAKGETVVMVKIKERDDDGKVKKIYHEIVTDPETIRQTIDNEYGQGVYENIDDEDHYHYVVTKPANNQAIEGMLNRAYGKAPEKVEIEGGFFKVDNLNIVIKEPVVSPEEPQEDVIDVEPESKNE